MGVLEYYNLNGARTGSDCHQPFDLASVSFAPVVSQYLVWARRGPGMAPWSPTPSYRPDTSPCSPGSPQTPRSRYWWCEGRGAGGDGALGVREYRQYSHTVLNEIMPAPNKAPNYGNAILGMRPFPLITTLRSVPTSCLQFYMQSFLPVIIW